VDANRRLSPVSMTANTSMLTAIANDFGYEEIFSKQIEMYAQKGDLFIAISSSGNSPNIVNAIKTAKKMGLTTAAFTGFEGGKTRELADIKIHVDFKNYGVVEDCHHIIMQSVAQFYYKSITA
jgi:phosphoheptose isomerase